MDGDHESPRIVVVGPCASGKSTLVASLRESGYDASICAQEHSEIQNLWNHTHPNLVVFLDVNLDTIRRRRSPTWPEAIFDAQRHRLESARAAADIIIDTSTVGVAESTAIIVGYLSKRNLSLD